MGMCDRGGCSSTEFADNALAFKTKFGGAVHAAREKPCNL
jgi:hypothetical protein